MGHDYKQLLGSVAVAVDLDGLDYVGAVRVFVGQMIMRGEKSRAERFFWTLLRALKERHIQIPIMRFLVLAMFNASPCIRIGSKKVAGTRYKLPVYLGSDKQLGVGVRWLREEAVNRNAPHFVDNLFKECFSVNKGKGAVIKRKASIYADAIDNIAFVRYLGY